MKYSRMALASMLGALVILSGRPAPAAPTLDDATILALFDQANQADILTGWIGAKHGASEDVRALGRMVASDHAAVQQMGRDLARKLNLVPALPDNDASVAECAKTIALLQTKRGSEFDRAYLRHEVAFHQSVIDALKSTLLPAASSGELKHLLESVLPGFEAHLAATKAAARKLGISQR